MSGSIQGLYPQYPSGSVRPVKKLESQLPKERPEDLMDAKSAQKMAAKAYEKYQSGQTAVSDAGIQASYSENPYDQARKNAEASLLAGQNIDLVA